MRQRFIQSFSTSGTEQTAIDNKELGKPYVAYLEDEQRIDWNTKGIDYANTPLTFEIISGGTIYWLTTQNAPQAFKTISFSVNDGPWENVTSSAAKPGSFVCNVAPGDKIQFKGNNVSLGHNVSISTQFSGDCAFNVQGNIMSLLYEDDFATRTTLDMNYPFTFKGLFLETNVVDASKLVLPATVLTNYCYNSMFSNCVSLTTAPVIPDATVGTYSLDQMFYNCTVLNYVKCLFNTRPGRGTVKWLQGVSPTGTFVKHPNATWPTGGDAIPAGWTVIDADI